MAKIAIQRSKVYKGMAAIALLVSIVFAFLFITNRVGLPDRVRQVIDPNAAPEFSYNIYGDFDTSLKKPMDMTRTTAFIYVSDTNNKRVVAFDVAGNPVFNFGKEGEGPGEFKFPYGISAAPDGKIFVADMYNGKISIHDDKGKFIDYFAAELSKKGVIKSPAGLRIINEKVYITDITGNKVLVLDMKGKLILEIGKKGKGNGQFEAPNAVTADEEGKIYVTDTGNQRVQVFDSTGKFIKMINGSTGGTGSSVFVNPRGVAVDSRGFIYVVSNLTHIIHAYNQEGEEMFKFGGMGEGNGQLYLPNGLYIDNDNNIYVSDTLNTRISVFN